MNREKNVLGMRIIRLKRNQEENEKKRDKEEKRLREENLQLLSGQDALLTRIENLQKKLETIKTKKNEDVKSLEKQINTLNAEKALMELILKNQPGLDKLSQLRKENTELSTKIEELRNRLKKGESDCKRL